MNLEGSIDIYMLPCVKKIASGTCCIAQGTQLPRWMRWGEGVCEGGPSRRGYMYTYV